MGASRGTRSGPGRNGRKCSAAVVAGISLGGKRRRGHFQLMAKTNEDNQSGNDQGNAIENETREADSSKSDPIEEIIRRNAKPEVSEEESTPAEQYRDGGESGGKKY